MIKTNISNKFKYEPFLVIDIIYAIHNKIREGKS